MSDEEQAKLCGVAYSALLELPHDSRTRHEMQFVLAMIRDQIARLREVDQETVQNEFERRAHV